MPNWVKNVVTVSEKTMKNIKENYFNNGKIDFNKIIPMPKTLNLTSGSITDTAIFYALCKKDKKTQKEICNLLKTKENIIYGNYLNAISHYYSSGHFEDIEESAKKFIPDEEARKLGITSLEQLGDTYINNLRQYGCDTWYDWCIENWGTKWGASRFSCNENTMIFETAWATPANIFSKLSKAYPDETIKIEFADEDYGSDNNGILTYKNGECEYDLDLGEDFIAEVWCEQIENIESSKDITDEMFD